jgi:hypothetical protein
MNVFRQKTQKNPKNPPQHSRRSNPGGLVTPTVLLKSDLLRLMEPRAGKQKTGGHHWPPIAK